MSKENPEWYELPLNRWRRKFEFNDSQRQRLYDAGGSASYILKGRNLNPCFNSVEEVQQFINDLIKKSWIRKRWNIDHVNIRYKRSGAAAARKCGSTIFLPYWGFNIMVVLHEFAHLLHPSFGVGSNHGRYFARTFLELVGFVLGPEARKILKEKYKKENVKYTPIKQYSEETLLKMKERGKQLAEKYF